MSGCANTLAADRVRAMAISFFMLNLDFTRGKCLPASISQRDKNGCGIIYEMLPPKKAIAPNV
jgi:hypothetical protein